MASSWHDVISGIPQGSVLGPILFVIYINTIVDVIQFSDPYLFADDTKMSKGIFQADDNDKLQQDINNIYAWSKDSLLKFHLGKLAAMRITTGNQNLGPPSYNMDNVLIKQSDEEKDLGVVIDSKLSFEAHMQSKINKGNSIMGIIRRTIEYLDEENFRLLFTALVRPQLEYANAVWSPHHKKHITSLENVQRRATKLVPSLSKLSYDQRLRKLGIPTLAYRRYRGDMIETFKITHGIYDPQVTEGFLPLQSDTRTRGHDFTIFKRSCHLDIRKYSFAYRIVDPWNNLPDTVVNAKTVKAFEIKLDKLWRDSDAMFNPECDIGKLTSARSLRYAE